MNNDRLFDILTYQADKFPQEVSLAGKENGSWRTYSTQEFIDTSNKFGLGLLKLGIKPGDKVAMISNNRPEWNIIDIGILQIGAINVPIYPTITEADYKFILNHAEVKIVIVSNQDLYEKVSNIKADVSTLQEIYTMDSVESAKNWREIVDLDPDGDLTVIDKLKADIKANDLATLIYTSGTTGDPKGVMLSHTNIYSNVIACMDRMPCNEHDKALSFLPLCHVYERMITYMYILHGVSIYYAEAMETIGEDLKDIKPQMFSTVPRLLEKVFDKIVAKGNEQTGIKKKLFFWALELGLVYEPYGANGAWYEFKLGIANKIIFNKWREALGGNVKIVTSGSAALQARLARVFQAAQIPVMEGYG
ncbi:MAG: AMP-binding protein, partial [Flavobacteriales bacterium]|nr:AMP-binding protein [Flavobacteriales bacterium]